MVDEHADEEVVELTEEMASVAPPPHKKKRGRKNSGKKGGAKNAAAKASVSKGNKSSADKPVAKVAAKKDESNAGKKSEKNADDKNEERLSQPPLGAKYTLLSSPPADPAKMEEQATSEEVAELAEKGIDENTTDGKDHSAKESAEETKSENKKKEKEADDIEDESRAGLKDDKASREEILEAKSAAEEEKGDPEESVEEVDTHEEDVERVSESESEEFDVEIAVEEEVADADVVLEEGDVETEQERISVTELEEVEEVEEPEVADEDHEEIDLSAAEEIEDGSPEEDDGVEINVDDLVEIPAAPKAPPRAAHTEQQLTGKPRRRRRHSEWWSQIFDESFMSLQPRFTSRDIRREADYISKSLALPQGALILDLGCGRGRQAVAMAQRGYRVVGIDLSLPMLARAGEYAQKADQNINFIHGDMRDIGFEQTFDGIYCVGTSFGFFDDAANVQVLEGIRKALKPGGAFLLEVANRDFVLDKAPNLTWFEGDGTVCLEELDFNYISSRIEVSRQIILGENSGRQIKYDFSLRLYSLHELGQMLHKAGFLVSNICGHSCTPDAFFGVDSGQIIILAQRGN